MINRARRSRGGTYAKLQKCRVLCGSGGAPKNSCAPVDRWKTCWDDVVVRYISRVDVTLNGYVCFYENDDLIDVTLNGCVCFHGNDGRC